MSAETGSSAGAAARGADALNAAAADWLARRDAGFAPGEAAAFARWTAADARHAAAVAEIESAWTLLNRPREQGQGDVVHRGLAARAGRRRSRRRTGLALTSLAAAAALALAVLPARREAPGPAEAASITVRPQEQVLADGTRVELNAGAQLSVEYTAARRTVRLLRGDAHFSVTSDPARPFVVLAGRLRAQAVGTAFAVRYADDEVGVLVTEGRVAVAAAEETPAAAPEVRAEPVLISAGGRLTLPAESAPPTPAQVRQVSAPEMAAALAWRGKRVEFSGTRLADAVALFNRENALQISLSDAALAGLRVSGIFWIDNPEGFARLLEGSFGVAAERKGEAEIALRAAP